MTREDEFYESKLRMERWARYGTTQFSWEIRARRPWLFRYKYVTVMARDHDDAMKQMQREFPDVGPLAVRRVGPS